jgi:hypothetical protein
MNIDMSIISIKRILVESNLLEELLGKGLKYTMVKMLTGINPAYFRF